MSEAIYEWMKNLAVFYIFLTAVMNIVPDSRYGEYIRFFMGLLLILLVTAPLMQVLQMKGAVDTLFQQKLLEEEYLESQWAEIAGMGEKLQEEYLIEGYERETEVNIQQFLKKKGYEVLEVSALLGEGAKYTIEEIEVRLSGEDDGVTGARIIEELGEVYGTSGENIRIFFEKSQ